MILNSKADKPVVLISGIASVGFCGGRKTNKLNRHVMPGPGIEPGLQRWEASALRASEIPRRVHLLTEEQKRCGLTKTNQNVGFKKVQVDSIFAEGSKV